MILGYIYFAMGPWVYVPIGPEMAMPYSVAFPLYWLENFLYGTLKDHRKDHYLRYLVRKATI